MDYSRTIHGIFMGYSYVSVMYRVCVGYVLRLMADLEVNDESHAKDIPRIFLENLASIFCIYQKKVVPLQTKTRFEKTNNISCEKYTFKRHTCHIHIARTI